MSTYIHTHTHIHTYTHTYIHTHTYTPTHTHTHPSIHPQIHPPSHPPSPIPQPPTPQPRTHPTHTALYRGRCNHANAVVVHILHYSLHSTQLNIGGARPCQNTTKREQASNQKIDYSSGIKAKPMDRFQARVFQPLVSYRIVSNRSRDTFRSRAPCRVPYSANDGWLIVTRAHM